MCFRRRVKQEISQLCLQSKQQCFVFIVVQKFPEAVTRVRRISFPLRGPVLSLMQMRSGQGDPMTLKTQCNAARMHCTTAYKDKFMESAEILRASCGFPQNLDRG